MMAVASSRCISPLFNSSSSSSLAKPFKFPALSSQICCCKYSHNGAIRSYSYTVADKVLTDIQDSGVIACLRAQSAEVAVEAARAALRGGISVLEVVMSTPGVFEVIRTLVHEYPSTSIGVGTVLNKQDARDAIIAGARFLMSPAMVKDILDDVAQGQALYIPGVMTPSEILSASNSGAKIVKVYPVSALGGVGYIAAVRKPFPFIPMVVSQGIAIDSVGEYVREGASSVVLSDAIFDKKAMSEQNFDSIYRCASLATSQGSIAVKRRTKGYHS
ncbi:uncharacterized protein [Primulina eburnea]|uniref:uncharacterized protein n=1 Tax=Primulina eburnea TaxID=1245227 RepID=UPI003C6C4D32